LIDAGNGRGYGRLTVALPPRLESEVLRGVQSKRHYRRTSTAMTAISDDLKDQPSGGARD
jgi:hypothetical protein